MMTKMLVFISLMLFLLPVAACKAPQDQPVKVPDVDVPQENPVKTDIPPMPAKQTFIMKGVDVDIPQADFVTMKKSGISILTTEWGMEVDINKTKAFLDRANSAGLKVVMDGGFTYPAWGFTDNDWDNLPAGKSPIWQKDRVQSWVKTFKDHPAVFGWDICNEYGENLPSGAQAKNSQWPRTAITLKQLKQARSDVLQIDPAKPILIRTYSWDFNEPPFGNHRPFEAGIAEIVMLNLYSNYLENNNIQWPTVIQDAGAESVRIIKEKDPNAKVWLSIAAFEDEELFSKPTVASLTRDINETLKIPNIDGIGFFEWGPADIGRGKVWYLPQTGADLWKVIQNSTR